MQNFAVVIQGLGWEDVQDIELLRAPSEGDLIETRYGTCIVTKVELVPDASHTGRITCRLP